MKACASCQRLFPDDAGYCPIDGRPLSCVAEVQVAPDPEDARVGQVLSGRYEVRRRVADGGMGRVYQALDLTRDRGVAVKILHNDVALDPIAVERFHREFQVSRDLPHEHIVEVYGFEQTADGSYFVVMEYLEGEELRSVLMRDGTIGPARLLRMFSQIAMGLGEAHRRKIIHRDLKPDNIFLAGTVAGDCVKILDFGSVRDNSKGAKKLTIMGTTIGSPYYMSPEQAQGLDSLDHRADVWALGAIAYECLTATLPFDGPSGPAILLAIVSKEPLPPSLVKSALPRGLDRVMADVFEKSPAKRIPTAVALVERLGEAFGLDPDHRAWAAMPEGELARLVASRSELVARLDDASATAAMDAAFQAGSAGGPGRIGDPGADDLVLPAPLPRWLVPALAAGLVALGVLVGLLATRL